MWAEEGMDGSGNQENLGSGLAVGVACLRQALSSRLHKGRAVASPVSSSSSIPDQRVRDRLFQD